MTYKPFLPDRKSQFDELLVVQQSQEINLKSVYGISALRDTVSVVGTGSVTNADGEYKLTTGAATSDVARLASAERGRYVAGQDSVTGIGVRVSDTPTGNIDLKWGYYGDDDGYGYGVDATGIYVFIRRGAVDTKVYQSSWNNDVADGTGSSGVTLTLSEGNIFQIDFTWYGFGTITFNLVSYDPNTFEQKVVTLHRIRVTGQTSIVNPNQSITAEVTNGATATAFDSLYIAGRQFSTRGKFIPSRRITSGRRLALGSINTTFLPLMSMRRKAAFESVSVKLNGLSAITDADLIVQIRLDASLTGASFTTPDDHSAAETALELDSSATAVTGGEVLWEGLIDSSGVGNSASGFANLPLLDVDFIGVLPVTVCVRRVTGTGATVSGVLRVLEEW